MESQEEMKRHLTIYGRKAPKDPVFSIVEVGIAKSIATDTEDKSSMAAGGNVLLSPKSFLKEVSGNPVKCFVDRIFD